jgi:hypothetical protein
VLFTSSDLNSEMLHLILLDDCSPKWFRSVEDAIKWSIVNNHSRNAAAAEISVPSQLLRVVRKKDATSLPSSSSSSSSSPYVSLLDDPLSDSTVIISSSTVNLGTSNIIIPNPAEEEESRFIWRTDLVSSAPYWRSWYEGLSDLFLHHTPRARLLVLAGDERLDTPLIGGHMEGKYQMVVFRGSGHAVQEDVPEYLSKAIFQFLTRNALVKSQTLSDFEIRKNSFRSLFLLFVFHFLLFCRLTTPLDIYVKHKNLYLILFLYKWPGLAKAKRDAAMKG